MIYVTFNGEDTFSRLINNVTIVTVIRNCKSQTSRPTKNIAFRFDVTSKEF